MLDMKSSLNSMATKAVVENKKTNNTASFISPQSGKVVSAKQTPPSGKLIEEDILTASFLQKSTTSRSRVIEEEDEFADFDREFKPTKQTLDTDILDDLIADRSRSESFIPNAKLEDDVIDSQVSAFLGNSKPGTKKAAAKPVLPAPRLPNPKLPAKKPVAPPGVPPKPAAGTNQRSRNLGELEDDLLDLIEGGQKEGFEKNAKTEEDVTNDQVAAFLGSSKTGKGTFGGFTSTRPR
jgi:hypothetical protein